MRYVGINLASSHFNIRGLQKPSQVVNRLHRRQRWTTRRSRRSVMRHFVLRPPPTLALLTFWRRMDIPVQHKQEASGEYLSQHFTCTQMAAIFLFPEKFNAQARKMSLVKSGFVRAGVVSSKHLVSGNVCCADFRVH